MNSPYYCDNLVTLYHGDSLEIVPSLLNPFDLVVLDPPFDEWNVTPKYNGDSVVCFTNFKYRDCVEMHYGTPRFELVWFFKDGRWTSHKLPRTTHETILYYGKSGGAYVGEAQDQKPQKKGKGCIGRDKSLGDRIYIPRKNKCLNSVLCYPRNVSNALGCWGKPLPLMRDILAWSDAKKVLDPYAGSGTTGRACKDLGIQCVMIERDERHCEIIAKRMEECA